VFRDLDDVLDWDVDVKVFDIIRKESAVVVSDKLSEILA
jgi:hypothetical protein